MKIKIYSVLILFMAVVCWPQAGYTEIASSSNKIPALIQTTGGTTAMRSNNYKLVGSHNTYGGVASNQRKAQLGGIYALKFKKKSLQPEPVPNIKVWFGNRIYQADLLIPKQPKIKIEVDIPEPYSLDPFTANYPIALDPGTPHAKTYSPQAAHVTQKTFAAGQTQNPKALTIEFAIPDELSEGEHKFIFNAKSSGVRGIASTSILLTTVNVLGGPLRIIDIPITSPSPFSPSKDKEVIIQYTLSDNANIDIFIYSIDGEQIKKISCSAGSEGGMGQLNKVKWNGIIDDGGIIGNGIYVGTIVSKQENKVLGKFKLNVFS